MRHGRAKQARKTLQFFARITNGALNPQKHPYSILLDGTFLVALVQYKLQTEIMDRLGRLLQHATLHLYTTRSTMDELQQLEQATSSSKNAADNKAAMFRQARTWAETHCTRILEEEDIPDESTVDISAIPTTPAAVREGANYNKRKANSRKGNGSSSSSDLSRVGRDFLRLVMGVLVDQEEKEEDAAKDKAEGEGESDSNKPDGDQPRNKNRSAGSQYRKRWYFVASQDEQVLDRLRHLGHVPIVRLARGSVLLLEQPSKAATQQAWNDERHKWRLGTSASAGGTSSGNATTTSSMLQQERNEAKRLRQEEREERRRQEQAQQPYPARRKKRAKGPNPLSCKSAKKQKR